MPMSADPMLRQMKSRDFWTVNSVCNPKNKYPDLCV